MNQSAQPDIVAQQSDLTFVRIALALAFDYETVYVINTEDDSYVEYRPSENGRGMVPVSEGADFYADTIKNCRKLVWKEDQAEFLRAFRKENVLENLKDDGCFDVNYRLVIDGQPRYYFLKTVRGIGSDSKYIIIGVRNIDEQRRKELSMMDESRIYAGIAQSLAGLFEVIYYINTETNSFTMYSSSKDYKKLGVTTRGEDFFATSRADIRSYVHPDDVGRVLEYTEKEALLNTLKEKGSLSITYRQMLGNRDQYVNMLVFPQLNNSQRIVMAVRNVDTQVRREQSLTTESETYENIIRALACRYEVIYYVNTENDDFEEYSRSEKYARLSIGAKGEDFFNETQKNMKRDIYPEDYPIMAKALEKETLLNSLRETGTTSLNYRLILDGRPQYVTLFALRPREHSHHIIIAVANVDAAMRREIEYRGALDHAMSLASRDALTGVKNKHAYVQTEIEMNAKITAKTSEAFALVVCDINGLKYTNDTQGHHAGDVLIQNACQIICKNFKRSPVFRIGGDEFVALLKGDDYDNREQLLAQLRETVRVNNEQDTVTVAHGISEFDPEKDFTLQDVFERADQAMYRDKKQFKHNRE